MDFSILRPVPDPNHITYAWISLVICRLLLGCWSGLGFIFVSRVYGDFYRCGNKQNNKLSGWRWSQQQAHCRHEWPPVSNLAAVPDPIYQREYLGRGVAFCPHCDGPFYKGKKVAVIGGGNSGVEAAIDLAGIASDVVLIEYGDQLKADSVLIDKLKSLSNAKIMAAGGQALSVTCWKYFIIIDFSELHPVLDLYFTQNRHIMYNSIYHYWLSGDEGYRKFEVYGNLNNSLYKWVILWTKKYPIDEATAP